MPKRNQLSDEVAHHVRELIMSGTVKTGDFLRLEPLAEELGVSITPVREGLLALSGEGFVELIPRRGFMVSEFSQQDVYDLFWVQAQLAAELAARGVGAADAHDVEALETHLRAHAEAIEGGDESRIAACGRDFHGCINKTAASPRLTRMLRSGLGQLPHTFYAAIEGHHESAVADHEGLLRAFQKSDEQEARQIMSRHILDGAQRLTVELSERGLWGKAGVQESRLTPVAL